MINTITIQSKCREYDIPFGNLLAGSVVEEILSILCNTPWQDFLYIKNIEDFGVNAYRRKIADGLSFVYLEKEKKKFTQEFEIGDSLDEGGWEKLINLLEIELKKKQIHIKKTERRESKLYLQLDFEGMYIPIQLKILSQKTMEGFPKKQEIKSILDEKKSISIQQYSIENLAAEHIFPIVNQLELLNEMEHYLFLYDALNRESLEGRKTKMILEKISQREGVPLTTRRIDIIESYQSYAYMKKKWKVLLRKEKRVEPSWEQTVETIIRFMGPIIDSIEKEEIFFGDWMPEIQRFLE